MIEITTIFQTTALFKNEKLCSSCKKPLSYIEQYKRWYCYNCQRYEEIIEVQEIKPIEEIEFEIIEVQPEHICSTCQKPFSYIKEYNAYYCYNCQKYEEIIEVQEVKPIEVVSQEQTKIQEVKPQIVEVKQKPQIQTTPQIVQPIQEQIIQPQIVEVKQKPQIQTTPQIVQPIQEVIPQQNPCPTCKVPLTFIKEYNAYYCYNCKKYPLEILKARETQAIAQPVQILQKVKVKCPRCSKLNAVSNPHRPLEIKCYYCDSKLLLKK